MGSVPAMQARPGAQLAGLHTRRAHAIIRPSRTIFLVSAHHQSNSWQAHVARCSAALRHLTAAHQSRLDVKGSLCIGVGVSALACSGGSGPNGPSNGGGGSWGSGGDGWQAGPGNNSSISNVLSDVAAVNDSAIETVEEVILLDVGGMKCGGCVGHVKRLLEEQPGVLHATVNLATETALVRVTMAKGADLDKLAADLAKVLTSAGFQSKPGKQTANASK